MIKTHFKFGCQQAHGFHAEVPFIRMPKVKLVGDMYEDEDGKKYLPELFDKFFKSVKTKVKGKRFKGELIGKHFIDQADVALI